MNAFAILETNRDASASELRSAYKRALLKYHPDKQSRGSGAPGAQFTVDDVYSAYEQALKIIGCDGCLAVNQNEGEIISYNEVIDLSSFEVDGTGQVWTRHCRCGEKGYVLSVDELEANGSADEIAVQCLNCSLWILVQYTTEESLHTE